MYRDRRIGVVVPAYNEELLTTVMAGDSVLSIRRSTWGYPP
ncbi:hypothetical protein [Methanosphaerula subterraneus]